MSDMKHTPAPWVLSGRQVYSGKLDDDNFMNAIFVASVCDRNKNDAKLIAAAPDLLDALTELVSCLDAGYKGEFTKARAAIAKATK